MNVPKFLKRNVFVFNPENNGGEFLTLMTEYFGYTDGEREVYAIQELSLQSYGNSASFTLNGLLTPDNLRKLAETLEKAQKEAEEMAKNPSIDSMH